MTIHLHQGSGPGTRSAAALPAVTLAVLLCAGAIAAESDVRLALPGTSLAVEVESYTLAGAVDPKVEKVTVRTPEGESSIQVDEGTFALPVDLSPGNNRFEIAVPGGESVTVNLFLKEGDETPPANAAQLKAHEFGVPDDIEDCGVCHPRSAREEGAWSRVEGKPETCAEACHDDIADHPYAHGPAAAGDCVACHNPHGSKYTRFLVTSPEKLCSECHDTRDEETGSVSHFPFEDGECTACHSPHGGENKVFFSEKEIGKVCFSCHDEDEMKRDSQHAPVAAGDCTMCHKPHTSENAHLLVEKQPTLCLDCHDDIGEMVKLEVPHPAVEAGCTTCHEPHSADTAPLLKAPPVELCGECHSDVGEAAANSKHGHPPVEAGECGTCHGVHGSDHPNLLVEEKPEICFNCHDEIGEAVKEKAVVHAPVEDGDCGSCHNSHGSDNASLLNAALEPNFYAQYSEEDYEFCFQCHDQDLAEEEKTDSTTGFRDGERNLHYVHVHREKGRTCRVCHDPHASDQKHLINTGVPFGRWVIPIRYSVSENGGRCEVGCHRAQEYSR